MCMELQTPGTYEWDEIQEMLADPLVLKRPCEDIFAEWEAEREASELGQQEGQE